MSEIKTLTQRENDVVARIVAGDSNLEVAAALGMRPTTVKFHLGRIFEKLGVQNRAGVVAKAMQYAGAAPAAPVVLGGKCFTEDQLRQAARTVTGLGLHDRKTVNAVVLDLLSALKGELKNE